jgi:SAM-dependent methyltransferase
MTEETYALSAKAAEFYESTFVPALFAEWAERLVAAAELKAGESVLDVACGTGAVARKAAEKAGDVVGLDRNEAMLAVARRLRPDLDWRLGDAGALPFGDGSFDVVVSQAALMFFEDRVAALAEMRRVSTADGRVVVQVPGRLAESPGYRALAEVVGRHANSDVIAAYFAVGEPDLLTDLFHEAGLRIDRFDTWLGATRLDDIDTFLDAELLPIADQIDATVRERIAAEYQTAGFTNPDGSITAPIEVHLIIARRL